jgi:rubrerythrin
MAKWICDKCGFTKEGRCKPKKCESCGWVNFSKEEESCGCKWCGYKK